ncbi:hypothetical protein SAMN04487898_106207 [Pedobacter sp. ok626]|uniref:hypothetical protein n=1 Tax=Pedobacter sp. ok626 TaxID=1761882 RepID=UPI0008800933|nr:hypothetical protein [Pedobacter sp. ok626]SDK16221.1 hypothetical protein SAMN04487898_106207 [Pedobacter sp. ok626]
MSRYIIIMSTVIHTPSDLQLVSQVISAFPGILEWSVDLEDSDQILRVVCNNYIGNELLESLGKKGLSSKVLEVFDKDGVSFGKGDDKLVFNES